MLRGARSAPLLCFLGGLCVCQAGATAFARVRRQRVHTLALRHVPFIIMVVFLMFGSQVRLVFRWEWLTLCPELGAFPQTSQVAIFD